VGCNPKPGGKWDRSRRKGEREDGVWEVKGEGREVVRGISEVEEEMEGNGGMRTILHVNPRDKQRRREKRRHNEEGKAAFALKRPNLIRLIAQAVAARRQHDACGELM
jgi:hypothetical protein